MAQKISQGNIFGRIGTGIGQGLAEQVPKEIENYRLRTGLKSLADEADRGELSPSQYLARAAGTYGATPQMIQSFSELAKQQQVKNAYGKNRSNRLTGQQESIEKPQNIQENVKNQVNKIVSDYDQSRKKATIPSNQPREEGAKSNPPAASENPTNNKYIPAAPWNQQLDEQAINEAFDTGKARTFDEAREYANRQRELYENAPEAYRKQLNYLKGVDEEVNNKFDKQLENRLQKEGKQTFRDVPGDLQEDIRKMARNSVATGNMTPEQAAEFYSKKALDLTKDRNRVLEIANRDAWDRVSPTKKEETVKNLKQISKRFADMAASENFYDLLTSDKIGDNDEQIGMGLSPGGAAMIAYEPTEGVNKLLKNTRISSKNPSEGTRDFAQHLFKEMTPQDSFLGIARQMKEKDPNFDEYAFFDYLRENSDQYGTNARLNREVSEGVSDFFPNWRDIGLFPVWKKPKEGRTIFKSAGGK